MLVNFGRPGIERIAKGYIEQLTFVWPIVQVSNIYLLLILYQEIGEVVLKFDVSALLCPDFGKS
jgi:hypothetical protein